MTTAQERKAIGDAFGQLAGAVINACPSDFLLALFKKVVPLVESELTDITVTKDQTCGASTTASKTEGTINYPAPASTFAPWSVIAPPMHLLEPGHEISTSATNCQVNPTSMAGPTPVTVSIAASAGRGLYIGRVCPANGGQPDVPVFIFIDGLT